MKTFGDRIKFLRQQKNLTMGELAKLLKVPTNHPNETKSLTTTTISNIENNRHSPNSDIVIALSLFFNVSADWLLFGREHSMNNTPPHVEHNDDNSNDDNNIHIDKVKEELGELSSHYTALVTQVNDLLTEVTTLRKIVLNDKESEKR
ncbi:helix-turn-helix domain-containing protein [Paenibacillus elgii]|uniref:helix-turn-helix domain-containing protein n=1 Tax=Paenibacillus elgii TaxID=189691 RepID=UPI0020401A76|nr:helix-turn-helix transcriptional regulator [Paenibacillus elgii]MCM3273067.1 helix-turn-helix domain-containing protein [Paenibacillus elgii]